MEYSFGQYGEEEDQFTCVSKLCMDRSGKHILLCDTHYRGVRVFTKDGKFVRTFANNQLKRVPSGVFVFKRKILVMGDSSILIFNPKYNLVSQIKVEGFTPMHICFLGEEFLLVTTVQDTVLTLDWNGCVIRKIGSEDSGQFVEQSAICTNSRGEILVTDSRHGVQIFSQDWQLLSCFNPAKDDLATMFALCCIPVSARYHVIRREPVYLLGGLLTDVNDNIFITDGSSKTVQMFTPTGDLIKKIPIANRPKDMFLLGRRLFVSCRGSICVFINEE